MFDTQKVFEIISSQIVLLQKHYESSKVDAKAISAMSNVENQICALRDKVFSKYSASAKWAEEGYGSSKSAIIHETHSGQSSISKAIARGKMLNEFESLSEALNDNLITSDHLDIFSRINNSKYTEYLERDIDLLVENAIKFDVLHFSHVINYWKNIVDDQIDETPDDYKNFDNRRLYINELSDGKYLLHGIMDKVSAIVFKKALEDIANKLRRKDTPDERNTTSKAAYRADAAGYLGQLYITASTSVKNQDDMVEFNYAPSISSDIIIDIEQLRDDYSTKEYLEKNLIKATPIQTAHSKNFVKQILCDSEMNVIVKNPDSNVNMGRKTRVATAKMKRILATQTNTCTIDGCIIPSTWCDAHHVHHWINGGETKIENLILICRKHHTRIHNDKEYAEKVSRQITEFKNKHHPPPEKYSAKILEHLFV